MPSMHQHVCASILILLITLNVVINNSTSRGTLIPLTLSASMTVLILCTQSCISYNRQEQSLREN